MTTTINYADGHHETVESLDAARDAVLVKYPSACFCATDGRWLAWEAEEESVNDDGARAVAEFFV